MKKLVFVIATLTLGLTACAAQQPPTIVMPTQTVTATPEAPVTQAPPTPTETAKKDIFSNRDAWVYAIDSAWDQQSAKSRNTMCMAWPFAPDVVVEGIIEGFESDPDITEEQLDIGREEIRKFFNAHC